MIQSSPTTKMLKEIYTHIEQRELKQAIDRVKVAVEHVQNWTITERITELETNYRFMLHYLIEGQKDPQQQYIYEKLIRDLYAIADDAAEFCSCKKVLHFISTRHDSNRYAPLLQWMIIGKPPPANRYLFLDRPPGRGRRKSTTAKRK